MNGYVKGLLWLGALVWALLTFLAANSPEDVAARANGWLALPIVNTLPGKLLDVVSSPITFALTFFTLGALAFWRVSHWREGRAAFPWNRLLGSEMTALAQIIRRSSFNSDLDKINAYINVLELKVRKHKLAFPHFDNGFRTIQDYVPYLTQVAAHLNANQIDAARTAAKALAEKPLKRPVEPAGGLSGY